MRTAIILFGSMLFCVSNSVYAQCGVDHYELQRDRLHEDGIFDPGGWGYGPVEDDFNKTGVFDPGAWGIKRKKSQLGNQQDNMLKDEWNNANDPTRLNLKSKSKPENTLKMTKAELIPHKRPAKKFMGIFHKK